jgi:transposase
VASKRGPKIVSAAAQDRRVLELETQVERLQARLVKADLIVDVQKNFLFR